MSERFEETVMQIIAFLEAINPVVVGILGVVLACGAVDWWIKSH